MSTLKLHTPAASAPVSLDEAKLHLRVTDSAEDTLISALINAATEDAEHITGRALMPQKWQVTADSFEGIVDPQWSWSNPVDLQRPLAPALILQRPPVTAIDWVKYVDAATGALTPLDPSQYQLAAASDYTARVLPAFGKSWPATRGQAEAVQIVFSCGYADAASVPASIKAWIKLRMGALYENREEMVVGQRLVRLDLPFVDSLLDRFRVVDL